MACLWVNIFGERANWASIKKNFVMRTTTEFNLALGIYIKNALKIVVCSHQDLSPKKPIQKGTPKEPFQGSFLGAKCYLKRDENA